MSLIFFWSKKLKNTLNLDKSGRKLVIGDIHGCIKTLQALIEKINLQKMDNLFLLGDYVDRGNDSKAVLDYIIQLITNGYKIFPLLGNHEDDMLILTKYNKPSLFNQHFKHNEKNNLINGNYTINQTYIEFFNSLPLFHIIDNYIFVHAGIDLTKKKPFDDRETLLWIRETKYHAKIVGNRTIIHGHTPTELNEIESSIKNRSKIICLDNGCVFAKENIENMGSLLCLNIDTNELFIQKYVD